MVFDERGTSSKTLLMATCCAQRDGTYTIIDQFFHQFAARHARIADCEVETVGDRFVQVMVIHNVEAILCKDLFQSVCTAAIFFDIFHKLEGTVCCTFEHSR